MVYTARSKPARSCLVRVDPCKIINMEHKEEEVDTSACTLGNKRNIPSQKGSALDKGCKETMS